MPKIEIFEQSKCTQPNIKSFNTTLNLLKLNGINISRYNPTEKYNEFTNNPTVMQIIHERGYQCLPVILINGHIASMGKYPEKDELETMIYSPEDTCLEWSYK